MAIDELLNVNREQILAIAAKHGAYDISSGDVAGLCGVLVHNCINVDLDVVWNIIQADLPDLKAEITAILPELAEEP